MKIVQKDNYNREYIADKLIAEKVPSAYVNYIVKLLNNHEGRDTDVYYFAERDDYKLWRGMEEYI